MVTLESSIFQIFQGILFMLQSLLKVYEPKIDLPYFSKGIVELAHLM